MKYTCSLLLLALVGCTRGEDSADTGPSDECGDVDGPDGEVPNVLGNWTGDFGKSLFKEYCGIPDLASGGTFPIDGAMEVKGRVPDNIYMTIDSMDDETRFFGLITPSGGVTFAGEYTDRNGTWNISFGGMAFYDTYRQRTVIEGFGWVGLEDDDGNVMCDVRGEWTAMKSGN